MTRRLQSGVLLWLAIALLPKVAAACAVCFGAGTGDNPDAAGLNAGVGVLFAVLVPIQVVVALFFARVARRSGLAQDDAR